MKLNDILNSSKFNWIDKPGLVTKGLALFPLASHVLLAIRYVRLDNQLKNANPGTDIEMKFYDARSFMNSIVKFSKVPLIGIVALSAICFIAGLFVAPLALVPIGTSLLLTAVALKLGESFLESKIMAQQSRAYPPSFLGSSFLLGLS